MKKLLLVSMMAISLLTLSSIAFSSQVHAVDVINDVCSQPTGSGERPAVCNTNENASDAGENADQNPLFGTHGIVTRALQIFVLVLGVVVVFVLLVNATRMITSSGDPASVASARNGMIYAIIGAVIALSAQLLVSLVLSRINN